MIVTVIDVETTGLSPRSADIIEIAAVRWDNGQVVDQFSSLVRSNRPIPPDIQSLTAITDSMLASAPTLAEVLPGFLSFVAGHPVAGHNVRFDVDFLRDACDEEGYEWPCGTDALDTWQLGRILLPMQQDFRLIDLAHTFDIQVDTAHRAFADVLTTAQVLTHLRERATTLPYVTLQMLERLASQMSALLAHWFSEVAETRFASDGTSVPDTIEIIHQLAFSRRLSDDSTSTRTAPSDVREADVVQASTELLSDGSPIQSAMPGFQVRDGQRKMVEAVSNAFLGDQHLIVEAGTGTGKSLAYLVPSTLFALNSGERVVIATHTISLQDQIRSRDFPTLERVVNLPLSLAVFKGRTHYVCMRKLWQELQVIGLATPTEDIEGYMTLLCWLVETPEGNREELSLTGRLGEIWPRIQSETETCINKRCPFFKACYYFRARQAAFSANVIVTNHALVLSDLKADHRVLPKYDRLVLDEAHHLEDEATKHLGREVHFIQCMALFGRLYRDGGRQGVLSELQQRLAESDGMAHSALKTIEQLTELLPGLRARVDDAFQQLATFIPAGQGEYRITASVEPLPAWRKFLQIADTLVDQLSELEACQSALGESAEMESDEALAGRLFDAHGFIYELLSNLSTLCDAGNLSDDTVQWIERSGQADGPFISLHSAPIDVGKVLSETLFQSKPSVVLTSATLSVEGDFHYVMSRLGLTDAHRDGRLATLTVDSPFDMPRQALLCVPNDVPELAKLDVGEAAAWLSDSLYQLAKASEGRLLALFTSHAMLRLTAQAVREPLRQAGLQLFAQGIDGGRTRILNAFRNHPSAVLFGAQSFWEGIDLPGDELTTLVIVRLPFAPPTHPVTAARYEQLEKEGKSSFWGASLPAAVVRFRQGFGRLIRTVQDRGVVVVYDKRIISTRYGSTFVKSLPGVRPFVAPEQAVFEKVRTFLHASDQDSQATMGTEKRRQMR